MIPIGNKRSRQEWSVEEDQQLLNLLRGEGRVTLTSLAAATNRSKKAVRKRAAHFGFITGYGKRGGIRKYSMETIETIRKMRKDEYSLQEIGKVVHLSWEKVEILCTRYSIKSPKRWSYDEVKRFNLLLAEGKSNAEIAAVLDRPSETIKYRRHRIKKRQAAQVLPIETRRESCLRYKLAAAKERCRIKEWEFDLTYDYLSSLLDRQNGRCYYTGILMSFNRNDDTILSIDRLDSTQPYTKDNVVLCLWNVNRMKQDLPMDTFLQLARHIANTHPLSQ